MACLREGSGATMGSNVAERSRRARARHDQISFMAEKGTRALLRALALREGIPAAKILTSAALARAGLHCMPSAEGLEALAEADTRDTAEAAIMRLQAQETAPEEAPEETKIVFLLPDEWSAILDIAEQIEDSLAAMNRTIASKGISAPGLDRIRLTLNTDSLAALRQILRNAHTLP